jgi:hypothetical protein
MIEIGASELIGLAASIIGGFWGVGRLLITSFINRQQERDEVQDKAREEARAAMSARLGALEKLLRDSSEGQRKLERELSDIRVRLAEEYVRRDDFTRVISIFDAKVDNLSLKFDNMMLRAK